MSILDKEFDAELLEQLNTKLAEAAKTMKEVNALRSKLGLDSLILTSWARDDLYSEIRSRFDEDENISSDQEMDDLVDDKMAECEALYDRIKTDALESQLNIAGWSTSSSYC